MGFFKVLFRGETKMRYLDLLGLAVEDCVTGYKGVVTSVTFDLYGCIQAIVSPPMDKDGKVADGHWLDVHRLKVTNPNPVMDRPQFDVEEDYTSHSKGPADKPAMAAKPMR